METPTDIIEEPTEMSAEEKSQLIRAMMGTDTPTATPVNPEGKSSAEYIVELVHSFPCLRGKYAHLTPKNWASPKFMHALRGASEGEYLAGLFIMNVWDPANAKDWPFNVIEALGTWDCCNRAAFLAWAHKPHFP